MNKLSHQLRKREGVLFSLMLSLNIGIAGLVVIIGGWSALVIAVTAGLGFLILIYIANGFFAARLRSESARISPDQLPELYSVFKSVCKDLDIQGDLPRLYVLEGGGSLNAFAMRYSFRNFVMLTSDLLDTFGADSNEIRFVIGHEIGHIKQRHLVSRALLFPAIVFPMIGAAYSRVCESNCDRYGYTAAKDARACQNVMLVFSGGRGVFKKMNPQALGRQHFEERGFFVSLHELLSGYPTVSKRISDLIALEEGKKSLKGGKNVLAYLFAPFVLNLGGFSILASAYVYFVAIMMIVGGLNKEKMEAAQLASEAQQVQYIDYANEYADEYEEEYYEDAPEYITEEA